MKELSIEEKARLYDEAIKRAREFVCKDNVEVAEYIFPELKESEDWIPKEIIKYLKEKGDFRSCWIAWLKKQGEPKESIVLKFREGDVIEYKSKQWTIIGVDLDNHCYDLSNDECVDFDTAHYAFKLVEQKHDKVEPKFKVGDKIVEKEPDECGCGTIIDIKDGKYIFNDGGFICIEEQGLWQLVEQKPAWCEEDINKPNGGIVMEDFNDGNGFNKVNLAHLNEEQVEEIEELVKRWNLQPKVDEDESIISDLLDYFDENKCLKHEVNDIVKWLKTIKPQQKVWCKNEIKMLDNLITYLDGRKDLLEEIKRTYIDWLKSIKERVKPQTTWKPSDEHYELEEFVKIIRGNLTGISKVVQELFEAKYLQLTGNKMYGGYKD